VFLRRSFGVVVVVEEKAVCCVEDSAFFVFFFCCREDGRDVVDREVGRPPAGMRFSSSTARRRMRAGVCGLADITSRPVRDEMYEMRRGCLLYMQPPPSTMASR